MIEAPPPKVSSTIDRVDASLQRIVDLTTPLVSRASGGQATYQRHEVAEVLDAARDAIGKLRALQVRSKAIPDLAQLLEADRAAPFDFTKE